jgi:hypothetical protein
VERVGAVGGDLSCCSHVGVRVLSEVGIAWRQAGFEGWIL